MGQRTTGWFLVFPLTVFLSAFLLFQVQPLLGKYILPWFGGSPSVWTACMLFFQVLLFAGYAYAHLTTRYVPAKLQSAGHIALLMAAVTLLPITPDDAWKPTGSEDPTWQIVMLLLACVGLSYFLLCSTGPLLQVWFHRVCPQRSPYPLYALSNLGSLLALVSYPFVFEPRFGVDRQALIWSWAFGVFAVGCGVCAWQGWRLDRTGTAAPDTMGGEVDGGIPTWRTCSLWFVLAMIPSVMLLAVTNQICTDVAVAPFLWVLPLTLYLLSFILCFRSGRWCPRGGWAVGWVLVVAVVIPVMHKGQAVVSAPPLLAQIAVFSGLLFCCAMWCHGELVRQKPHPAHLTSFYLTLSAGGAAGGLLVGLVAPVVFPLYVELPLAILGCTVLILTSFYRDRHGILYQGRPRWAWSCMLCGLLGLVAFFANMFQQSFLTATEIHRNFYGVTRVQLQLAIPEEDEFAFQLIHGRTLHGKQFASEARRHLPTTYYGRQSGVGRALEYHRRGQPKRVGVIGLGVGTLAVYGNPGDEYRFYEINPDVIDLAERFFDYLPNCQADWEIVAGDARIRLENESPQAFDVLVLDAFSSDAIPLHLLTEEAFALYLQHLAQDGILAAHASNVHLDLRRVLAGHAKTFGLQIASLLSPADEQQITGRALWVLMSRDAAVLDAEVFQDGRLLRERRCVYWTDNRNSQFEILMDAKRY